MRAPDNDPLRMLTFCPGSRQPVTDRYVRRVGRPRADLATEMDKLAIRVAGSHDRLGKLIKVAVTWERTVDTNIEKV